MKRIDIPIRKVTYHNWSGYLQAKIQLLAIIKYAINLPFKELPQYLNHEDVSIKAIVEERLKGKVLLNPDMYLSHQNGEYKFIAYVLEE